jgi:beta-glucosidase
MSAYNAVNGEPCSANVELLQNILRDEWGFDGYVVSDCGAIGDIYQNHHKAKNYPDAAARSVQAGCDLNCGGVYKHLRTAIADGLISEETINQSAQRLFEARMRLGMFDDPERVPYNKISPEIIDCLEHRALALEASRRSMTLLKNDGTLPLDKGIKKIAVIGPNADSLDVLLGNYNGIPSSYMTALAGIRAHFSGETVFANGCHLKGKNRSAFDRAVQIAQDADAVVLCLGLSPRIEGEEGDAFNADASGDKLSLKLPGVQEELLELLSNINKPLIAVIFSGSPVDLRQVDQFANAVILAWYPRQDGGKALAEILFGDFNTSGRLPVTFVRADDDLPPFEDYSMKGRTYRYLENPPLYPFGFGLSYTAFEYSDFALDDGTDEINASVQVKNTGERAGGEVVQFYLKRHDATVQVPNFQLCGFKRIELVPGESAQVTVKIPHAMLEVIGEDGISRREPGRITFYTGGQQPDARSEELTGKKCHARIYQTV